jgi:hypothetical protein
MTIVQKMIEGWRLFTIVFLKIIINRRIIFSFLNLLIFLLFLPFKKLNHLLRGIHSRGQHLYNLLSHLIAPVTLSFNGYFLINSPRLSKSFICDVFMIAIFAEGTGFSVRFLCHVGGK